MGEDGQRYLKKKKKKKKQGKTHCWNAKTTCQTSLYINYTQRNSLQMLTKQ